MISTSVVDVSRGAAVFRMPVQLDAFVTGHGWREVGSGITNREGRVLDFGERPAAGVYRLMFDVAAYNPSAFFPSVTVTFEVKDPSERYHISLVLSSFGYSAYREP
jgi:5-hydroxyisourate hydrolase